MVLDRQLHFGRQLSVDQILLGDLLEFAFLDYVQHRTTTVLESLRVVTARGYRKNVEAHTSMQRQHAQMHELLDVRLVQSVLSDQILLAELTITIGIQDRPELHC